MQKIQDFIVLELEKQKNHVFLWFPFFFAVGIALYFGWGAEPSTFLSGFLFVNMMLLCGFFWRQRARYIVFRWGYYVSVLCLLVLLGFNVAKIRTDYSYTPMLQTELAPVQVTGVIKSVEKLPVKAGREQGSRVVLGQVEIEKLQPRQTPKMVRLKIRKDEGLQAGQRVTLLAGLNPASAPVAPDAFDFRRMAYFQGIGAVGFAYYAPTILQQGQTSHNIIHQWRQHITRSVETYTVPVFGAVVTALMTGQRAAIPQEQWDAFRQSGLAHLLAISGMHVGMVAGVVFFFVRAFLALFPTVALRWPIKKWAAVVALCAAMAYTFLVGATIPTQRALLMTGFVMIAIMMDRSPFSLRLVAVAAGVVLFFTPESLTSVSFQMSFAAVTALICFYEWSRPYWINVYRKRGILPKALVYITGVMSTTVVAGVATGLFSLFHFQSFALYGVLANIVAVPIMSFIVMPLIVLSYALMPLGMEGVILPVVAEGVGWILATALWVSKMDGAVLHVSSWPHWIFVLMVVCAWCFFVWQGRLRYITIPVFMLLVLLAWQAKRPDILLSDDMKLIAFNTEENKLWLSSARQNRYTATNWLRLNGQEGEDRRRLWPREGKRDGFPLRCDDIACRGQLKGQSISVVFSPAAVREECEWANILISQQPVKKDSCGSSLIFDRFDVWEKGAHALWLSPDKVRVRTVAERSGQRPWTTTRE